MTKLSNKQVGLAKPRKGETQQQEPRWQARFSKRLPHRVGQPLSSSGGGDGCAPHTGGAA
jgi:hypothetical protein